MSVGNSPMRMCLSWTWLGWCPCTRFVTKNIAAMTWVACWTCCQEEGSANLLRRCVSLELYGFLATTVEVSGSPRFTFLCNLIELSNQMRSWCSFRLLFVRACIFFQLFLERNCSKFDVVWYSICRKSKPKLYILKPTKRGLCFCRAVFKPFWWTPLIKNLSEIFLVARNKILGEPQI